MATLKVDLLHRVMPVVYTRGGFRALHRDRLISEASKECCLQSKFGETLEALRRAMEMLARSLPPQEITLRAFHLYQEFRPEIPASVRRWGAAGKIQVGLRNSSPLSGACGYSQSGQIMSAIALLNGKAKPTDLERGHSAQAAGPKRA